MAKKSFPSIGVIIFSGGECFLLGTELLDSISHCVRNGFKTRCVTNGYWANSPKSTSRWIADLKKAGLTEINFSTGDEHQKYVPVENVVNAAIAAAEADIRALITVETGPASRFDLHALASSPVITDFMQNSRYPHNLQLMGNAWVRFVDNNVVNECAEFQEIPSKGCEHIFETITISPEENMLACCGLAVANIPEMTVGNLKKNDLKVLYQKQSDDFMKVWLKIDGPEAIMDFISDKDPSLRFVKSKHPCANCAQIYANTAAKKVLGTFHIEKVPDIIWRYQLARNLAKTEIHLRQG